MQSLSLYTKLETRQVADFQDNEALRSNVTNSGTVSHIADTFLNMSSYSEGKSMDLAEKQTRDWVVHNAVQLSRTYPAGRRTDSSNYDPMPMWLAGAQIGECLSTILNLGPIQALDFVPKILRAVPELTHLGLWL